MIEDKPKSDIRKTFEQWRSEFPNYSHNPKKWTAAQRKERVLLEIEKIKREARINHKEISKLYKPLSEK